MASDKGVIAVVAGSRSQYEYMLRENDIPIHSTEFIYAHDERSVRGKEIDILITYGTYYANRDAVDTVIRVRGRGINVMPYHTWRAQRQKGT